MLSRRIFLKNSSLGLGLWWMFPKKILAQSALYQGFVNPSAEAKPFMRWWWNGNCVTADEIKRELQVMHQAGIGGVEINPIAMPEYITQPSVGKPLVWMGDEYCQMLEIATNQAKDLGMKVDLIVGTGWPFGGKFIEASETLQGIKTEVKTLLLNGSYDGNIGFKPNENQRLFQLKLVPKDCKDLNEILDITSDSRGNYSIKGQLGEFDLFILIWQNKFRDVQNGSLGGDGPVLDHFNAQAVKKYLNRMTDALKKTFGEDLGKHFRAFFCDSVELNGANWTGDLAEQFRQRRGYSIEPYLCFVLNDKVVISEQLNAIIQRARFDYTLTMSELFMERFVTVFHEWCHQNGVKSRYQAYGFPSLYNPMIDGFAVPDIPEGDQWLFNNGWQPYSDIDYIRYAIWNKYATSAGHQQGRSIISTEAMTNNSGVFRETLSYIKQATDLNFITGINHLIFHGFNYTPQSASFPGWVRLGTFFNEQSPWWQYMLNYSTYTARISQVLQNSKAVSKVGVLGPTADVWAKHGSERNAFNSEPWYLHSLWQALNSNGYMSDYVSEKLIHEAQVIDKTLACGWQRYEVLLVVNVKSLSTKTFEKIQKFAKNGGKLIFIEQYPSKSTDKNIAKDYITLLSSIPSLLVDAPTIKSLEGVADWAKIWLAKTTIKPNVQFEKPNPRLFFIHQKTDQEEIIFFSNADSKNAINSMVTIVSQYRNACEWNPETGETTRISLKNGKFNLNLLPLQSLLVVLDNQSPDKKLLSATTELPHSQHTINGTWKLTTKDAKGKSGELKLDSLVDFLTLPNWKNFSGEITYQTEFEITSAQSFRQINLGEVHETAEVWLNGTSLGLCWYSSPIFDLKNQLKKGINTLQIKVTTTLYNFVAAQTENPATQFWQAKTKHKSPMSTGLLGPVQLG